MLPVPLRWSILARSSCERRGGARSLSSPKGVCTGGGICASWNSPVVCWPPPFEAAALRWSPESGGMLASKPLPQPLFPTLSCLSQKPKLLCAGMTSTSHTRVPHNYTCALSKHLPRVLSKCSAPGKSKIEAKSSSVICDLSPLCYRPNRACTHSPAHGRRVRFRQFFPVVRPITAVVYPRTILSRCFS